MNPKTLNLAEQTDSKISFKLTDDAKRVTVYIFDLDDYLVRQITMKDVRKGEQQTILWDGRDDQGRPVTSGAYIYTIFAKCADGRTVEYDVTEKTAGIELKAFDIKFNEETGDISYVLPKAALVRIRVGLIRGALLNTLLDWVPQEAGQHTAHWDFQDRDGFFKLKTHPEVQKNLLSFSLPDNAVIVEGGHVESRAEVSGGIRRPKAYVADIPVKQFHALHARSICHEPEFELEILTEQHTEKGLPVIKGATPIRVTVRPEHKAHLLNVRFEVLLFCDLQFVYEEEEVTSPFTFRWDSRGLTTREHILTVNLMSFDDHIGSLSKKVWVEASR